MALASGTLLGPYEILAAIGAGGMGEVYRARDSKLNRDVALKILPNSVAHDAERVARFKREAQVLASLNHPHIAAIYGLEDGGLPGSEGQSVTRALVLELVEGPTLADRIAHGPIPVSEALPIVRQIAEALEAAHEQGIVHRDLKPANVKVRDDGTVKVLDFGLAKALEPAGSGAAVGVTNSPTTTTPAAMTHHGVILGTAAYMPPEQAKGRSVDKRADIWAFGCVLYEMLTGQRAFPGEDVSDTLAAVLKTDPEWAALPIGTPPAIRRLLRRCLERDVRRRLQSIGDARIEIEEGLIVPADGTTGATGSAAAVAVTPPNRPINNLRVAWSVAAVLLAALAIRTRRRVPDPFRTRPCRDSLLHPSPEKTTFVTIGTPVATASISPDGRTVAFTARDTAGQILLWVRPIDALTAHPLAGTDNARFPFWSPDSRFIAYFTLDKLVKIAANGGPPQTLCLASGRGGTWNRDGVIVFAGALGPLLRVSSAGGQPLAVTQLAAGQTRHSFPSFLPDGRHVVYYPNAQSEILAGVYVASVDTSESKRLLAADSAAVYAQPDGYLLFLRQGTLLAESFDPKTMTLTNDPFPIAERVGSSWIQGLTGFSVSDDGALAYGVGSDAGLQMVWVDRQGKLLGPVGPEGNYRGLDLSPDGTRVAAHRHDGQGGDVWLTDLARGTTSRFTFDATNENSSPIWSPDGGRIVFSSLRNGTWGLYVQPSNGAGTEERLAESDIPVAPMSWSPDGRSIVYWVNDPKTGTDLWLLAVTGDHKAEPLLHTPFGESHGQISPDGRWLAYQSNESGRSEVYVKPFPTGAGKWQVSTGGGNWPRWRGDGRELFYMYNTPNPRMTAVDVKPSATTFEVGTPRALFDSGYFNLPHGANYHTFAVSRDGQRFLIPRPASGVAGESGQAAIAVVLNWAEGVKK